MRICRLLSYLLWLLWLCVCVCVSMCVSMSDFVHSLSVSILAENKNKMPAKRVVADRP